MMYMSSPQCESLNHVQDVDTNSFWETGSMDLPAFLASSAGWGLGSW